MKTQEELNILRNEIETLGNKLAELSDDELKEVFGGTDRPFLSNRHNTRSPLTNSPKTRSLPVTSRVGFVDDDTNVKEGQSPEWYGLDNVLGNEDRPFEPGSRYWERWINNNQE